MASKKTAKAPAKKKTATKKAPAKKMAFPKADVGVRAFFETVVPDDPRVELKPMFGHLAAFVNGNMFAGTYGDAIVVRADGDEREQLLAQSGASVFEPMKGRPMKSYVAIADAASKKKQLKGWLARALEAAAALPAKVKKPKKA